MLGTENAPSLLTASTDGRVSRWNPSQLSQPLQDMRLTCVTTRSRNDIQVVSACSSSMHFAASTVVGTTVVDEYTAKFLEREVARKGFR